ncbi:MAG: hypothetical protein LUP00_02500, partial [Methanothrix sp.]|nr:hypothetical protein [Methanothrix sp.]
SEAAGDKKTAAIFLMLYFFLLPAWGRTVLTELRQPRFPMENHITKAGGDCPPPSYGFFWPTLIPEIAPISHTRM